MTLLALAVLAAAGTPDEEIRALQDLRHRIREKSAEAARLLKTAHEDLDRGLYEDAVGSHRRARTLEAERDVLRTLERGRIESIAALFLPDLDHEAVEVRDRASRGLVALGPGAIPVLEKLLPGDSAEVEYRLTYALAKLRRVEIDADGRFHQWASTATASSEYQHDDWSAMQATGKPDTEGPGDARTAWASLTADGGEEWLELGYEAPVLPVRVRIHETYNPGAVVKVEARDGKGGWTLLWQGRDPVREGAGWCELDVAAPMAVRTIRITLDSANVPGWNEIDAVELIGDPAP
jgi:hypothetical protein